MYNMRRTSDRKRALVRMGGYFFVSVMVWTILILYGASSVGKSISEQPTPTPFRETIWVDMTVDNPTTPTIEYDASYSALTYPVDDTRRYGFTTDEVYLLAQLLCGDGMVDGDGEYDFDFDMEIDYYEVGKVLSVVMNRVRSDIFPNDVESVVTQPGQFEVMPANLSKAPSDISLSVVQTWCDSYDRYDGHVQVCPESHMYFRGDGRSNTTREVW